MTRMKILTTSRNCNHGSLRVAGLLAVTVTMLLVFCACQNREEKKAQTEESNGSALQAQQDTSNAFELVGDEVQVVLKDYKLELPESLPSGVTRFLIRNEGTIEHSFAIEGNGIDRRLDVYLQPGAKSLMRLDLEPATYKIYCPVIGHISRGAVGELKVTSESGSTGG